MKRHCPVLESADTIADGTRVTGSALLLPSEALSNALAVTEVNELLIFPVARPDSIDSMNDRSVLEDHEAIAGIDNRPATGDLVAMSDASIPYSIDVDFGVATALGDRPGSDQSLNSI